MTTQECTECKQTLSIARFEHQRNRPSPRKKCKGCRHNERDLEKDRARHRAYMKNRRITDPVGVRQIWERCKYGVSKEDLGVQECAICGGNRRLSIDHDHTSGIVRGLLCTPCNAGLGMFGEDKKKLESAIRYLSHNLATNRGLKCLTL